MKKLRLKPARQSDLLDFTDATGLGLTMFDKTKWPDILDAQSWMTANNHLREVLRHVHKRNILWLQDQMVAALEGAVDLTREDRWALLAIFRAGLHARRRRDQIPGEAEVKAGQIAAYSMLLEADGLALKEAVEAAGKLYGVSRAKVYAARRRFRVPIEEAGLQRKWRDPQQRQKARWAYENVADFWWSDRRHKPTLGAYTV